MRRLTAIVIAGVAGLAGAAPALAADPPGKRPPIVVHEPPPFHAVTNGWYLRGDLGYRWNLLSHVEVPAGFTAPGETTLGSGWAAGIGTGFKQDWLRVDVTADYGSQVTYTGSSASGSMSAKLQASTVLLNAYYEPYTFDRITPYIGAGVGAALVRVSDYSSATVPPLAAVEATRKWNLAFAVMAGASYAVSRNLSIDAGYRYLNLGTADTGADALNRRVEFKNIMAHELRLGLRFMFPDPPNFR